MSKHSKKAPAAKGSGPNKIFYLIIAAVVVLGGAGLVLAGVNRDEGLDPMSLTDTVVEADAAVGVAEGALDAPATLVEFSDYQCPHCAAFNGFTAKLLRQNYVSNGMLRWVVYEFPLDQFPNAIPAAIAGRCARDQGKFFEMRDLLFGSQQEWRSERSPNGKFERYAAELGLDRKEFASCLKDREHLAEIMAARKYGQSLGVSSTPTLFFNGRHVTEPTYEALEERIIEASAEKAAGTQDAATGAAEGAGS